MNTEITKSNEAILTIKEDENGDICVRIDSTGCSDSLPVLLGYTLYELTKDMKELNKVVRNQEKRFWGG